MKNKIIAVWGNNGSGKSLLSCAIANKLAAKDSAVIVISTSKQSPMFRSYLPMNEENPEYSLGKLLTGTVTLSTLKNKINIHPSNSNLGFMSLVQGDNSLVYQSNWKLETLQQMVDLITQQELATYIIFDCGCEDIFADNGTLYALENADAIVRVASPDNRSISFFEAAEPVMRGGNFRFGSHLMVINNAYEYSPVIQMVKDYGYSFVIPHSSSAYKHFVAGQLIEKLDSYDGYAFELELKKLVEGLVSMLG
ncbi:MAG: hypothetical protein RSF82_06970 [Angelakisella sp.]